MNTTTGAANPLSTGMPANIHPAWYIGSSALGLIAIILIGEFYTWYRICLLRAKHRFPEYRPNTFREFLRIHILTRARRTRRPWWRCFVDNICCCCPCPCVREEPHPNIELRLAEEGRLRPGDLNPDGVQGEGHVEEDKGDAPQQDDTGDRDQNTGNGPAAEKTSKVRLTMLKIVDKTLGVQMQAAGK